MSENLKLINLSDYRFLHESNPIEIIKYIKDIKDIYQETDTNYYIKNKTVVNIGSDFGNFIHIPFKDIAAKEAKFFYCVKRFRYLIKFAASAVKYHMFLKIH